VRVAAPGLALGFGASDWRISTAPGRQVAAAAAWVSASASSAQSAVKRIGIDPQISQTTADSGEPPQTLALHQFRSALRR